MNVGAQVTITGCLTATGRILGLNEIAMIVSVAIDRTVTLRRDPASTTPEQWRYQGLPVTVAVRAADFADRLTNLEERTREGE